MYKTGILFLDTTFENDIYELTRAFYPASELLVFHTEDEVQKEEMDLFLTVQKEDGSFLLGWETENQKGQCAAEQIKGQSPEEEDALVSCDRPSQEGEDAENTEEALRIRRENKDVVKILLYHLLVKLSQKELPWGALTGIRPVKLATDLVEEGIPLSEVAGEMQKRYLVSEKKAALAEEIAKNETTLLSGLDLTSGYNLYVGIPFCPTICLYCSFSSYPLKVWQKKVDAYLDALEKELHETALMMREAGRVLHTVYIGGGTPTTLEPAQMERLLTVIEREFDCDAALEFTVEAGRPDSITREKLEVLRSHKVSRISVNPQTMNQSTLDLIGRRHTVEETEAAFLMARDLGFDNINMDLIVGLPGEDEEMVRRTLERVEALGPDSLTVHSLAVKRAARLNIFKDEYKEMTFENNQRILDHTIASARRMDMVPYYLYRQKNMKGNFENVGYAKVDKACIYNILIMEEKETILASGAGGASKLLLPGTHRLERVENVKDVKSYLERTEEMIERKRQAIARYLLPGADKGEMR